MIKTYYENCRDIEISEVLFRDIFDEREIKIHYGVEASTFKQSVKDIRPEDKAESMFD